MLWYPDPAMQYIVDCDTSAEGEGAVLSQEKEGKEWVVAYCRRNFSAAEKKLVSLGRIF